MIDIKPEAPRIRTIRGHAGELLGFGVTAPGGQTITREFSDMGTALHNLNKFWDFIEGKA